MASYTLLYPKALFFPGVYLVHSHDRITNKLLSPPYSQEENLFFSYPEQSCPTFKQWGNGLDTQGTLGRQVYSLPASDFPTPPPALFLFLIPLQRSGTSGGILGLPMCLLLYDLLLLYIMQKRILEWKIYRFFYKLQRHDVCTSFWSHIHLTSEFGMFWKHVNSGKVRNWYESNNPKGPFIPRMIT